MILLPRGTRVDCIYYGKGIIVNHVKSSIIKEASESYRFDYIIRLDRPINCFFNLFGEEDALGDCRLFMHDELKEIGERKVKEPLGLISKVEWIENRKSDIQYAIARYSNSNKKIPIEWIDEYNSYINK